MSARVWDTVEERWTLEDGVTSADPLVPMPHTFNDPTGPFESHLKTPVRLSDDLRGGITIHFSDGDEGRWYASSKARQWEALSFLGELLETEGEWHLKPIKKFPKPSGMKTKWKVIAWPR